MPAGMLGAEIFTSKEQKRFLHRVSAAAKQIHPKGHEELNALGSK